MAQLVLQSLRRPSPLLHEVSVDQSSGFEVVQQPLDKLNRDVEFLRELFGRRMVQRREKT